MSKILRIDFTALTPIAALAVCLAGLGGSQALSQAKVHGKLGTAGVEVQASDRTGGGGKLIVVKRDGREFAKYSVPAGTQGVLLCCTFGHCIPIGPDPALACDIVVYCPGGWACTPQ
jgi:hypothetical protein